MWRVLEVKTYVEAEQGDSFLEPCACEEGELIFFIEAVAQLEGNR